MTTKSHKDVNAPARADNFKPGDLVTLVNNGNWPELHGKWFGIVLENPGRWYGCSVVYGPTTTRTGPNGNIEINKSTPFVKYDGMRDCDFELA